MASAARKQGRIAAIVLPAILMLASAEMAGAGGFRITPTLGDVAPHQRAPSFRIHNPNSEALTVQVSAYDWQQQDNMDVVVPTDQLLVVPPLATIGPGDTQIVRVALRGARPATELSFRLHVQEILPPPPPGFTGLRTAVKVDLPLFFAPAAGKARLDWQATQDASGAIHLSARNLGSRFTRLTKLSTYDVEGQLLIEFSGPQYVLVGATRIWELPEDVAVAPGSRLQVRITNGLQEIDHSVVVREGERPLVAR